MTPNWIAKTKYVMTMEAGIHGTTKQMMKTWMKLPMSLSVFRERSTPRWLYPSHKQSYLSLLLLSLLESYQLDAAGKCSSLDRSGDDVLPRSTISEKFGTKGTGCSNDISTAKNARVTLAEVRLEMSPRIFCVKCVTQAETAKH